MSTNFTVVIDGGRSVEYALPIFVYDELARRQIDAEPVLIRR
jgi:hypothetical protein